MTSFTGASGCSESSDPSETHHIDGALSRIKSTASEVIERRISDVSQDLDREGQVLDIAQVTTTLSAMISPRTLSGITDNQQNIDPFDQTDPRLNPQDASFDLFLWTQQFSRSLENEGIKRPHTGFSFKNLDIFGSGADLQLQTTLGSIFMTPFGFQKASKRRHTPKKHILHDFCGSVRPGEMLFVLGRPGSGCSTLLKTICGRLEGLDKPKASQIYYNGVPQDVYTKELRGELAYNEENEQHFPHLTVAQTLRFAAAARTPANRVHDIPREKFVKYASEIMMRIFGLSHVRDTKVGNDFVRGVSGGERKRVSIAEMAAAGPPIAAWDNATRGLDAGTALDFVRNLRISSRVFQSTHVVAIYQASQTIYDIFDKATLLYEGRQIYFGPACNAKQYFEDMGWVCPPRQTTGDFLTSVTNPRERIARAGFESRVPRTPEQFECYWRQSEQFKACLEEVEEKLGQQSTDKATLQDLRAAHHLAQAKHMRQGSPYRINVAMQIKLCMTRSYQRMWNDRPSILTKMIGQSIQALIIGSIYYGTPGTTSGFFAKGAILFFALLMNALMCLSEISSLYKQRPIVEKQFRYAFYHPFADALAGVLTETPVSLVGATIFNMILYFLGGLRLDAGSFFTYLLFLMVTTLTMSAIFRTIAASTKEIPQAMTIAGIMILAFVIYTGFVLTPTYMHPWFKWITYINPVAYAYEALLVSQVHSIHFPCAATSLVPPYGPQHGDSFRCAVTGSLPGQLDVSGDNWMSVSYGYSHSHLWRNLGIMFAFMIFFYATYLIMTERNCKSSSGGEYLVFRRGHVPYQLETKVDDLEAKAELSAGFVDHGSNEMAYAHMQKENSFAPAMTKDIFTWRKVTLDIPTKSGQRRLLDNISGYVKPGTLTALMGVSGAGKTTLLNALAGRIDVGVLTGEMFVNGDYPGKMFARKTGYVQQQDVHLATATVREALMFSATLRHPGTAAEKLRQVENVIDVLGMQEFSEAIVGAPGQGLNVEQRKLLTIGVELAAAPELLLFLDEPTSGLDSQSSWSIMTLLKRLADNGQAVLSTIHQPSAMLFQQFDRLLFLAKGGKTVYFGDIGVNSRILLDYFETSGARKCHHAENPAEYMLEVVNKQEQDWPQVWNAGQACKDLQMELDHIHESCLKENRPSPGNEREYVQSLKSQFFHVTKRGFQQYWRTPQYVLGKLMLCIFSALFVGFSFYKQDQSQTGMQNTIFAIFMITTIFSALVQQIMPRFVAQRSLYETRERPSKTYSWLAFILSNIIVELPYQFLAAVLVYTCWYFSVFGIHQPPLNQFLMLLFTIQFYMFNGTFAYMVISALPSPETGATVSTLLFSMILTFDGVLQPSSSLPGFWRFMWRVSPLTYLLGGWAGTGLAHRPIHCADHELAVFDPPMNQTCSAYLKKFFEEGALGALYNPTATQGCQYCPLQNADQFLALSDIYPEQRYRNLGIGFAYVVFNIIAAVLLYYVFREKRWSVKKLFRRQGKAGRGK